MSKEKFRFQRKELAEAVVNWSAPVPFTLRS